MLERLLEQRSAVTLVLADVATVKPLSGLQWSTAADLTETLRPFLTATELMSGAQYPTMSMILPVVDGLRNMLHNAQGGLDVLRDLLLAAIDDKFGSVFDDEELCVATVVDPRFKSQVFDDDDVRQRALDATRRAMVKVAEADACDTAATPTPSTSSAATPTPSTSSATVTKPVPAIFAKLYANTSASQQRTSATDVCQHELNLYMAATPIEPTTCPLTWWSANKTMYPHVAAVARRLLAVPATSVASERLFSKAGDVITKKRNRLESSKADKIIFLMENLSVKA